MYPVYLFIPSIDHGDASTTLSLEHSSFTNGLSLTEFSVKITRLVFIVTFGKSPVVLWGHGIVLPVCSFVTILILNASRFNPFPLDKILDQTKLKAFTDDKLNVTKNDDFCL